MQLSPDYDPDTWTPEPEMEFCESDVGRELLEHFEEVRTAAEGPYDNRVYDRVSQSLNRLANPGRFLSPEEEFVAARMNYVARRKAERWAQSATAQA
jgi:hypothetical protein